MTLQLSYAVNRTALNFLQPKTKLLSLRAPDAIRTYATHTFLKTNNDFIRNIEPLIALCSD